MKLLQSSSKKLHLCFTVFGSSKFYLYIYLDCFNGILTIIALLSRCLDISRPLVGTVLNTELVIFTFNSIWALIQ